MRQDICGVQFSETMKLVDRLQLEYLCGMLTTTTLQVSQIILHLLDGKHQILSNISELPLFVGQVSTGIGTLDLSNNQSKSLHINSSKLYLITLYVAKIEPLRS